MESIIIEEIPFSPDVEKIYESLHIHSKNSSERIIHTLIEQAIQLARPKAVYKLAFVEKLDDRNVRIGDENFTSKLMVRNLEEVNRVFAYVATCGRELHEWEAQQPDSLSRFYAYSISSFALMSVRAALIDHISERFQVEKHATMNPGSLEDWPITEQLPLFRLIGREVETIGVELTEGYLMVPGQTVSGILFETEKDYVNCKLCPRKNCPNRRAPYEEALYSEIFD